MTEAQAALDAHTREMVGWHFSPETGSPYWLERAKGMDFDPLTEITCFADMLKFDNFDDEMLRKEPPSNSAFSPRPL